MTTLSHVKSEVYADLRDLLSDTAAATTDDPDLDETGDPRIDVDQVFDRESIIAAAYTRDADTGRYRLTMTDLELFEVCLEHVW